MELCFCIQKTDKFILDDLNPQLLGLGQLAARLLARNIGAGIRLIRL
ncbi:hypothetical protein P9847_20985 [Paenibacillus chibensis]|uniref:Uncharacterized protein n=1 Tax=Paenibacillus chibensis TaxID=59846 RepID=A0ABU6PY22_9BACL|nr:hypothetical protein [Paenibacillus chibensis]